MLQHWLHLRDDTAREGRKELGRSQDTGTDILITLSCILEYLHAGSDKKVLLAAECDKGQVQLDDERHTVAPNPEQQLSIAITVALYIVT